MVSAVHPFEADVIEFIHKDHGLRPWGTWWFPTPDTAELRIDHWAQCVSSIDARKADLILILVEA
eukprot:615182-Heterocapsa_arctica.AAC.1